MTTKLDPVHPGEILNEEFLKPLGITQYKLAQEIEVPPRRINEIVHAQRAVTADTAVRLARFFGTSEIFWMNLQSRYELDRIADGNGARSKRFTRRTSVIRSSVAQNASRARGASSRSASSKRRSR